MLQLLATLLTLLLALPLHSQAAPPRQPNIILIFVDDLGWSDFSCFGNKDAQTPHIDQLAEEGIRFHHFYVNSPICSPSRVAITTGQYPPRWDITSYLAHRKDNHDRGIANWLDPQAPTLPRLLHHAGYTTGHFGKWHMGGQRDVDDAPPISSYGFDESLTNFEGMGAKLLPLTLKPGQTKPDRIWADAERLGQPITWMLRSDITAGFVDATIRFINQASAKKQPFYINVWPDDVHSPFWPPVDEWGDGSKRTRYLAVLENMDQQLGRLFNHVRNSPSLRNNTLILLCSDNGPEQGAGQAAHLRGFKTQLYEGGIRSPLITWGPGLIAKNKENTINTNSVFAAIDLAPSLLALTHTPCPENTRFDGASIPQVLLGQSSDSHPQPLFFRRPPDRNAFYGDPDLPDLAARSGPWKLLCEYDGSLPELYHLLKDPSETTNLASQYPDIVAHLTQSLTNWNLSLPQDNGANFGQ